MQFKDRILSATKVYLGLDLIHNLVHQQISAQAAY